MKFIICHQKIFFFLLYSFCTIFSDPLYFNNANPFPIFSSQGRYDYLTSISRKQIKEFILKNKDIQCTSNDKIFHANFMPYIQTATTGTNYEGKETLFLNDNRNQSAMPIDTASAIEQGLPTTIQTQQPQKDSTANLIRSVPMPLGSIPEPWNFFALFYDNNPSNPIEPQVYANGALLQAEFDYATKNDVNLVIDAQRNNSKPNDSSNFNQVAKVVARSLGYNDTPFFIAFNGDDSGETSGTASGTILPNSLNYDYSNYKNNYFGLMQYPTSRDPKKLFGYGYFNTNYKKTGIRGTFEWKLNYNFGFKIYTGFSNLDINQINIVDTTINYQGPTATMMFARYPDPIYQLQKNSSPNAPLPYISPNIYQLNDYSTPIMDNTSNTGFNDNFYNSSELSNFLPDEFKTAFLQNVQYNLDNLGNLIHQNFRPYAVQSFDDTTFELFYRKLIVYNKRQEPYREHESLDHTPFTLMPTASVHVTCPIAPRVPSNKIFGKPLDNNGHWELGANCGIEFDFINNIVLGADVGFSWYNSSNYYNVPVPTNQFNEGIYLYNANINVIPGFSYTASLGMQVDELFKCVDFFIEYRLVRHAEDNYIIYNINNLLPVKYMENAHQSPAPDAVDTLDTVPNGILFLNNNQPLPYPKTVVIEHMKEISSWLVNMINLTCNFRINQDMKLGFAWQQPFALRNAYNSTTLGVSFEMYL